MAHPQLAHAHVSHIQKQFILKENRLWDRLSHVETPSLKFPNNHDLLFICRLHTLPPLQGGHAFGSVCLFVCLLTTLLKNYKWIAIKFYGGVRGRNRNKWLDFASDPKHDLALIEVCALWMLGNWWLPVDIWWQRNRDNMGWWSASAKGPGVCALCALVSYILHA